MEEIDYLEQRIDSIKDRVRNFEFIDNGLEDKRNMMYIMSELAKAQKDKTKLLIKQKKLLDTRSFGRKVWDFVKEDPMTALFILVDDMTIYADFINNNLKSKLSNDLMMLLYKSGYPPVWNQEVFQKIMEQVDNYKYNQ